MVLGRDRTSCLNRPICSANADVVASKFPQENIIIQANLINLLPVDFCFLYIDVAAIDNLAMLCRFGCYCVELAAIDRIGRASSDCTCCYAGNLAVFSNSYFAQLSTFSSDLAVVAACIAYEQLAVTQGCVLVKDSLIDRDSADFACGCSYFAVFIYHQFAVGSIECTVAVYEERHGAVFICSTYGQVVFCIQCIGLDRIGPCDITFFVNRYFPKFRIFRTNLAVVTLIISYKQGTISQRCVLIRDSLIDRDSADFTCGCGYFAVFVNSNF